jgi:LPXTG-motif cell wall-anchored protein
VTIPTDTDPGSHSIVVIAASGATASTAFTVLAATGSGLAHTGAAPVGDLALAGLLLAIGLVFAMAGRRRRATLTR